MNTRIKGCLLSLALLGAFCLPILVILIFDWLNIKCSDMVLLICCIIATAIPLVWIFIKAFQLRKQVLAEKDNEGVKSK